MTFFYFSALSKIIDDFVIIIEKLRKDNTVAIGIGLKNN